MTMSPTPPPVPQGLPASPCVGICSVGSNGVCVGCLRTLDEIARWRSMGEAERGAVWRRVLAQGWQAAKPVPRGWGGGRLVPGRPAPLVRDFAPVSPRPPLFTAPPTPMSQPPQAPRARTLDQPTLDLLQQARSRGRPPLDGLSARQAREFPSWFELLFGPAPRLAVMRDVDIPGADGARLHARLYADRPDPDSLVVYLHGGGWVLGSVAGYEPYTALLAQRTGSAVLSVDYRLAPEHPFPAPLHDAQAALQYAAEQGASLLGRPMRRLVVMGDSAGAALATVAARKRATQVGLRQPDLQVLLYPVTDAGFDTPSYRDYAQGYLLSAADMRWFWGQYCPDPSLRADPDASPLRAADLSGLPPTLLFSAEFDPLRDEGERYGQRLQQAGVSCRVVRCPGVLHGFVAMARALPLAASGFDTICDGIRRHLA